MRRWHGAIGCAAVNRPICDLESVGPAARTIIDFESNFVRKQDPDLTKINKDLPRAIQGSAGWAGDALANQRGGRAIGSR